MPLQRCEQDGKQGWRWGESGACYFGPNARSKALKQARAIRASGYTENFNPSQPRDAQGRWSSGGGGGLLVDVAETEDSPEVKLKRRLDTRSDVEREFGSHEKRFLGKLSEDEKEQLSRYTGDNSINEELRSPSGDLSDRESQSLTSQMDAIDSAIEKSSFPKHAIATRYLVVDDGADLSNLQGKTIRDKSYLSTSLESKTYRDLTSEYAGNLEELTGQRQAVVHMEIRIEKGAKAAMLGGLPSDRQFSSSEVLLPRNAELKVTAVRDVINSRLQIGGRRTIKVEAVYE